MAKGVSSNLRDIIWRNKHMNTQSKVRIYKTCIRFVIKYVIETRAEKFFTNGLSKNIRNDIDIYSWLYLKRQKRRNKLETRAESTTRDGLEKQEENG